MSRRSVSIHSCCHSFIYNVIKGLSVLSLFIGAFFSCVQISYAQSHGNLLKPSWHIVQSIGLGGYSSRSEFNLSDREVRFRGVNLVYQLAMNRFLALRVKAVLADLDGGFESDVDLSGFGGDILLGFNLNQPGFRAYIAPGLDARKLTFANDFAGSKAQLDEDNARTISAFILNAGIGYRYDRLILDVWYAKHIGDKDSQVWTDIQPREQKKVNGIPVLDVNGDPVFEPVDSLDVRTSSLYFSLSYLF